MGNENETKSGSVENEGETRSSPVENENETKSVPAEAEAAAEARPGPAEAKTESKSSSNKVVILIAVLIVAVAGVVIAHILTSRDAAPEEEAVVPRIGYAEGVVAVDENSLQAAVDAMYAGKGRFVTEYKNDAMSNDGETFACYIGNSALNTFDMYIQIFADAELTDQLFLSELLRPGTVFKEITLDHPLEPGSHTVYVIFTQVQDDQATLEGQSAVTMEFTVAE